MVGKWRKSNNFSLGILVHVKQVSFLITDSKTSGQLKGLAPAQHYILEVEML